MKYAVITGASKGLGEAIAKSLIAKQFAVVTISRTENEKLKMLAQEKGTSYQHFSCNLSLESEVQEVFMEITHRVFQKEPSDIFVFNNAGVIEPIATVGHLDKTPIDRNITVNLTAPIMITNLFLHKAQFSDTAVHIINITSGAAVRPIQGWSVYCSAKAGLNMFTQTVASEQAALQTKHSIIAFSPGIMDTDMQATIRSSSEKAFKDLKKFQEYQEKGMLLKPDMVANALIDLTLSGNVESGKIYNVNDLLN